MSKAEQFPVNAGKIEDIHVEERACANANNSRGRRSFEWRPWEDENGRQRVCVHFDNPQVTYYYREPCEVCGAHAHRGDNVFDPDRNPEEVFFIVGNVEIEVEDLWGRKTAYEINVQPGKPVSMKIPPWVLHTFRVGDRGVHFMETKRNPYSRDPAKQDVITEPDFRLIQKLNLQRKECSHEG